MLFRVEMKLSNQAVPAMVDGGGAGDDAQASRLDLHRRARVVAGDAAAQGAVDGEAERAARPLRPSRPRTVCAPAARLTAVPSWRRPVAVGS